MIRAEELVGGNSPYGVPIYWQIESKGADVPELVTIGSVPDGWTETVRYRGGLPDNDLIGIEGTRNDLGMSFRRSALSEDEVLRGTYDTVSLDRFYSEARDECDAMQRGALVAGLLGPLLTAAALAALWRLHRAQPDSWGEREARRGLIWLIALIVGSYWTLTFSAVRRYEVHIGEIVLYAVLALIPAALVGLVALPVAAGIGRLGRSIVPEGAQRWAAIGGAIGAGALFWAGICGLGLPRDLVTGWVRRPGPLVG